MRTSATPRRLGRRIVSAAGAIGRNRRGAIAVTFALLAPLMVLCMVGAIDLTSVVTTKTHLQQATDSAALAVSATTSETPTTSEATLKTLAQTMLGANFITGTAKLADFHVCTALINDCTTGSGVTMAENTVYLTTTTQAPCYVPLVLPGVCTSDGLSATLTDSNTSNIGIPSNIQINMLMDVSGSMIVGSTAADVTAIETWNNVPANWAKVNDPSESGQSTPCAFACHDEGVGNGTTQPTTSNSANSDMQAGLTNAHTAGATTRFDVMLSAASNLITHVKTEVGANAQLAKNSYYFNVSALSDSITSAYTATTANDWTDPVTAINKMYVGLDTHFDALSTFASSLGKNGNGATPSSPIKFLILVTDGLKSDFYHNVYNCTGEAYDTYWDVAGYYGSNSVSPKWNGAYATGPCYVAPMPTAQCTTMKNNGVILAVLETPYVPLTGQDPGESYLYETLARHVIYPGGPNTSSTVSAALQSCASPGYYYQASSSDPTTISTGFVTLTDKFLASTAFIRQ